MRIRSLLLAAALALIAAVPTVAGAQAVKPPTNDDCLACHGDSSAARDDGRSIAVLPDVLGASVHGVAGLACVDCHADLATVTDFPHAAKLAPAACAACHEAVVTQVPRRGSRAGTRRRPDAGGVVRELSRGARHQAGHRPRLAHAPPERRRHVRGVPWPAGRQDRSAERRGALRRQHPRTCAAEAGTRASRRTAPRATVRMKSGGRRTPRAPCTGATLSAPARSATRESGAPTRRACTRRQ